MPEIIVDPTGNRPDIFPEDHGDGDGDGARKRGQKKSKPRVPSLTELFWKVRDAVNHSPLSLLPEFPHLFLVYKSDINTRHLVIEHGEGLCEPVGHEYMAEKISAYLNDSVAIEHPQWIWKAKTIREFVDFWALGADVIEQPKSWAFRSDRGRAFVRLPWDPTPGPTPTWDGFLSRMTNVDAFVAYVGSLYVECSDRQQYLWLYGEGNDGKGSLFRFLHRCFGASFGNEYVPERNDSRFWTSGLLHKRVVVFPDCNNYGFVTTGLFKSLTGGDPVRIERKNEQPFTTELDAKFIFGSNDKPRISGEKSDTRRLIYCELDSWRGDYDPSFERRLWEEGGHFIAKCLEAYEMASPAHEAIQSQGDGIEALASSSEEDLEAAAEMFDYHADLCCTGAQFRSAVAQILNTHRMKAFADKYLPRVHGIRKRKDPRHRTWVYPGMIPKTLRPPLEARYTTRD